MEMLSDGLTGDLLSISSDKTYLDSRANNYERMSFNRQIF